MNERNIGINLTAREALQLCPFEPVYVNAGLRVYYSASQNMDYAEEICANVNVINDLYRGVL